MSATVKHIPSTSSSNLDAYLEREKEGNDLPRVLYEYGQGCRPETAAQEFRALREAYGQQGAVRRVSGTYVEPEDPAEATHIKIGKNWREAKRTETATHLRVAPETPYVKRDEAHHFVFSFDLATVNPEDPEQTQRAFEAVVAFREEYTPGTQSKFVAHGDARGSKAAIERGEGGKFHVHEAMNAVVHTDMEVEGRQYRRGQRVAGAITHVDTYRTAWDDFLARHGHEFGLGPQDRSVLPEVGSPEYRAVARTDHDHWVKERGGISDHDRARRGIETAYAKLAEDPSQLAGLSDAERVERLAAEAAATGDVELKLRQTRAGEVKIRSFAVPGRKQSIGSTRLGYRYANATATVGGAKEQLDRIAAGTWEPYERGEVGPPKEIERLPEAEITKLQQDVDGMAAEELEAQWAERARSEPLRRTRPAPKRLASTAEVLEPFEREYGRELVTVRQSLVEDYLRQHPGADPKVARQLVNGQLYVHAMDGSLGPDLDAVRADLEAADLRSAAEAQRADEPAIADRAEKPSTEVESQPQPATAAAESTPTTSAQQRTERRATHLTPEERRSAELVAVVRSERADGGAYVDFQLAEPGPGARERAGLHLLAEKKTRKRDDGTEQEFTRIWTQLTRQQYEQLRFAAGDNRIETEGKTVYALASDIGPRTPIGHVPNPNTFQSSARKPIGEDVLARQRAAEDRGRETERAEKERLKHEPVPLKTVSKEQGDHELQRGVSRSRSILEGR
ncbi:hypothetical protein GMA10_01510 [Kocuria koreensis]|uniref:Uncharacterized protein n=1 Tax=Rothia koreensis TaxID=592378 RepID=A0A7K1LFF4_9MICC|nr:hypothetical protein [Rothia koreensis]MUN53916.1 hypothetical protein [Rothia koreensis]